MADLRRSSFRDLPSNLIAEYRAEARRREAYFKAAAAAAMRRRDDSTPSPPPSRGDRGGQDRPWRGPVRLSCYETETVFDQAITRERYLEIVG